MNFCTHRRGARRALLLGITASSLLTFSGPSAVARPAQQQPSGDKDALAAFQAMAQGHAEFRRAVLAEFHKVAAKRNQQMDFPSLIITSCSDTCMLAGVATSRAPAPEKPEKKPEEGHPAAAPLNQNEPLGLVAVAGSFLSVRSRLIDASGPGAQLGGGREASQVGIVKLQPGFYVVRRGPRPNLLELVNLQEKVAVTIAFQPGHPARGEGGAERGPRGAPEHDDELGEASEWPTIFMELLHSVDLSVPR